MIYIIRHGQTNWNLEKRIQGQTDIPLNETGIKQAKELNKILKDINYDIIYTSDLLRTVETAKIINTKNKEIIKDNRIREVNYGIIEGKTRKELTDEMWYYFNNKPDEIGSEPVEKVYERIRDFIDELDKEKDIIIVTHGGAIRFLVYYLENQNKPLNKELYYNKYNSFRIPNGEIFVYSNNKVRDYNNQEDI